MRQQTLTEGNVVAIWLGDFDDFLALDEYLGSEFESDYGFSLNERSMPEISEPNGSEHGIGELLDGFSFCEGWLDDAVRLCEAAGWQHAKAAVVFYHLRYRPELCRNAQAPLQFVCNVPWHTIADR